MYLYLVQHARAKTGEEDPQRPLSEDGLADIKKMAVFLNSNKNIKIDKILYSVKLRAKQTAEILAQQLAPTTVSETSDLAPLDEPSVWAERVSALQENIMLVGHLPHLSRLASKLLTGDEHKETVRFQMGATVCLTRQDTGIWVICWMIIPDMLV